MCRNTIWQLLASWLVAGSLVVLASCSLRPVPGLRLMKQSTQKCQEAADLLEGVQDAASAKAAAPRLEKLLIEIDQIGEKLERTYDPRRARPRAAAIGPCSARRRTGCATT
jgi:hypothetical protein